MPTGDQQVGSNIKAIRGARGQQAIADEMRSRGWKWSQATVWAVEKGERPLRLTEAVDLADILGVSVDDLHAEGEERLSDRRVTKAAAAVVRAFEEAAIAVAALMNARDAFEETTVDRLSSPFSMDAFRAAEVAEAAEVDKIPARAQELREADAAGRNPGLPFDVVDISPPGDSGATFAFLVRGPGDPPLEAMLKAGGVPRAEIKRLLGSRSARQEVTRRG